MINTICLILLPGHGTLTSHGVNTLAPGTAGDLMMRSGKKLPASPPSLPHPSVPELLAGTMRLVWHDEFNGPAGAPPDSSKWAYDLGGTGWGNRELQHYTNHPANAALDGKSCLAITARQVTSADPTPPSCWYGPCRYTSARLLTMGRFSLTYGMVAARIKIPFGQGTWPAFWMLGDNIGTVGWPDCGEIDIMENIGREPGVVHGTIHGPGYSGSKGIGGCHVLPAAHAFAEQFHVFAIQWQPKSIRWYLDNQLYFEVTPAQLPQGAPWPFGHPFFLLLNLAVGGEWPGDPDGTTQFPQTMLIDFVRVYQAA